MLWAVSQTPLSLVVRITEVAKDGSLTIRIKVRADTCRCTDKGVCETAQSIGHINDTAKRVEAQYLGYAVDRAIGHSTEFIVLVSDCVVGEGTVDTSEATRPERWRSRNRDISVSRCADTIGHSHHAIIIRVVCKDNAGRGY